MRLPSAAAPAPAAPSSARKKRTTTTRATKTGSREFNELTGGECAGGEGGVKWAAVRAWQQKHWQLNNLLADGLVGPRRSKRRSSSARRTHRSRRRKARKPRARQTDKEAPQPGNAEGAEASADKPKLDEDADEQVAPAGASQSGQAKPAAGAHKQATLAEFDRAASKLKEILAQFKPPKGEPGEKPIAEHYVEGTEDTEAPPALGAMMKTEVLQGYEAAAEQLKSNWGDRTPEARAKVLLDAVNEALAAEKVPAIIRVQLQKMPNPGEFMAKDWLMYMNEQIFKASAPPAISEVASQVFHEGRHAEQRFVMARLIATKHRKYDFHQVAKAAGVLPEVGAKACALRSEPLSPDQEKSAESFKHSTVDNPAHKNIEENAMAITHAANETAALFRALDPSDQLKASALWQELRQQAIAGLEAYYHLATERDAYTAQKQLADAIK